MLDLAADRAKSKGLSNVETMLLDLTDLSAIPSSSIDVVTANFCISHTDNLAACLSEVYRVLKPGGHFCGTDWQSFSIIPFAKEVMSALLGLPPPPAETWEHKGALSLMDPAVSDAAFDKAYLQAAEGHNALGEIVFDLGPIAGDSAWMSALISCLGDLEKEEANGDLTIRERAKAAVGNAASQKGFIQDDNLTLPGTFRGFRVMKSA